MRTRVRDIGTETLPNITGDYGYWHFEDDDGETRWVNFQSGQHEIAGYQEISVHQVTKDVEIENFHARVSQGETFNNPFSTVIDIERKGHGILNYTTHWHNIGTPIGALRFDIVYEHHPVDLSELIDMPALPEPPDYSLERMEAVTGAHANMVNTDALLLVSLAEGKKTAADIRRIATLFKRAMPLLQRGKKAEIAWISLRTTFRAFRRDKFRAFKVLSNEWMSIRYGLKPIMYEIQGLIDAISSRNETFRTRYRYGVKYEEDVVHSTTSVVHNDVAIPVQLNYKVETRLRAGILAEVRYPELFLVENLGLGAPVSTLWELTKLSFVLDWFMNTADFFASYDPHNALEVRHTWLTIKETRSFNAVMRTDTITAHNSLGQEVIPVLELGGCYEGLWSLSQERRIREVNPPRPILPVPRVRFSALKAVDLLIISSQMVSKLLARVTAK
mgnify:CR=1 FL=1